MTLMWTILVTQKLNEDHDEAWKKLGYKSRSEAIRDQARKLIEEASECK